MNQKFYFLCGHLVGKNFIYATKFAKHPWHYFEKADSNSSVHDSLPAILDSLISTLKKVKTIEVPLSEEQSRNYYKNGKFIFKNKELKTCLQLNNKQSEPSQTKSLPKITAQLVFIPGQTNPVLFLNEFEKCRDLKSDKEKMCKIRNFVTDVHRARFSELYFTSDWLTVRRNFLKTYSVSFTANKKKALNIDFNEETTLRSFVERKLESLSSYTTLPFINQMEMVLNDLPNNISSHFLLEEKITCKKEEVLDFCDSIQDLVQTMWTAETTEQEPQNIRDPLNRMEIFDFDADSELESVASNRANNSGSISRGSAKRGRGTGRQSKKLEPDDGESSNGYEFLNEIGDSSRSSTFSEMDQSMSVDVPRQAAPSTTSRGRAGKIVKKPRGRPRKTLVTIPENSDNRF